LSEPDGAGRKQEYLVERKIYGSTQRVTVIDPETGQEASATGPLQAGVQESLTNIAIKKLRRGISI
jgi:hypothetical protein